MPREHDRVAYFTEVELQFASGRREARISDLSEGGCYVEYFAPLSAGETVKFDLRLPDGERIPVEGEVTYAFENMGFGVRFVNMSERDTERLREIVAKG